MGIRHCETVSEVYRSCYTINSESRIDQLSQSFFGSFLNFRNSQKWRKRRWNQEIISVTPSNGFYFWFLLNNSKDKWDFISNTKYNFILLWSLQEMWKSSRNNICLLIIWGWKQNINDDPKSITNKKGKGLSVLFPVSSNLKLFWRGKHRLSNKPLKSTINNGFIRPVIDYVHIS